MTSQHITKVCSPPPPPSPKPSDQALRQLWPKEFSPPQLLLSPWAAPRPPPEQVLLQASTPTPHAQHRATLGGWPLTTHCLVLCLKFLTQSHSCPHYHPPLGSATRKRESENSGSSGACGLDTKDTWPFLFCFQSSCTFLHGKALNLLLTSKTPREFLIYRNDVNPFHIK